MPREPESFEAAVAKSIEDWLHRYMPAVAESLGPLPDTVLPSAREKLERWNLRTDQVPPGPMTDALADEALKAILEQHQQAGTPPPDPDTLTKLVAAKVNAVLYPYRQDVYGRGIPKPEQRVKEAEKYARMAQKQAPSEPTPVTEPPSMPMSDPMALPPAQGMTRPAMPQMPAAVVGLGQREGVI